MRGQPQLGSDIYAVGIVVIEALTGIQPHQLPTNPDTLEISWRNSVSVSPELANILDKMTRHHFPYRYQSATEVLQDLKYITTLTNPSPTIPSFPPPKPKPKLSLWISLVSLGMIATAIVTVILNFAPITKTQPNTTPPSRITW